MNFFEAQDKARQHTSVMVLLFGLAVLAMIGLINYLVLVLVSYKETGLFPATVADLNAAFAWDVFLTSTFVVCLVILAGSAYKITVLGSGGRVIAESLGGKLIPQNSQDARHRKILNVVEEMAIASGSPVPSVYLLDEEGINAFAAGWRPSDAVIGVTRGAVDYLSRDELQGVIAHEFSHIYNGDMRMNIRLMGILYGILLLGMIGYYLMRMLRYAGRSNNREGDSAVLALMLLGLGLTIIGYVGTFFGNWIKAIISRQREYLADASAVQFTRNRDGIAGALKKIGAFSAGSRLMSPAAHEYSHAYFSAGVGSMLGFMFSTHPPLKKRIYRIDPRWNGEFVLPHRQETHSVPVSDQDKSAARERLLATAANAGIGIAVAEVLNSIEQMGQVDKEELGYARDVLNAIPDLLKNDVSDPYGVRAIIYCLVISKHGEVREKQWDRLRRHADQGVAELAERRYPLMTQLHSSFRLPLMDLAFPALRALSIKQYQMFRENLLALIEADNKTDFGEWIIQRFILQHLDEVHGLRKVPVTSIAYIGSLKRECELLLSLLAYAEHRDDALAQQAFTAGIKSIGAMSLKMIPRKEVSIKQLDEAIDKLDRFKPLLKQRLLTALVACISTDGKVTVAGLELIRTIASCFHCPLPALQLDRA